jgi:essential nuclear protein 1
LDPKTSERIFELAKDQQQEIYLPEDHAEEEPNPSATSLPRSHAFDADDDDDEMEVNENEGDDAEEMLVSSGCIELFRSQSYIPLQQQIDSGDLDTMDAMLPPNAVQRRTLADLIFAKLESTDADNPAVIKKIRQGYVTEHSHMRIYLFMYETHSRCRTS